MADDYALQIVISSFVSLLGSSGVVWLTKQWISERLKNAIKSEYDLKLETHKAELKSQSDVEMERLRSQLNLTAKEHDVVFSGLHGKRAEAVAEIYAKLNPVYICLTEYVVSFEMSGGPSKDQRLQKLNDAHKSFFEAYKSLAIFLPETIDKKIDGLNKMMVRAGNEFTLVVRMQDAPNRMQKWTEIEARCAGEIQIGLDDLAREFRRLLGDRN